MGRTGLALILALIISGPVSSQPSLSTYEITIRINADMSVDIDGKPYTGDAAIKAKLEELRDHKPSPRIHLAAEKTVPSKVLLYFFKIAQEVGGLKLGFTAVSK